MTRHNGTEQTSWSLESFCAAPCLKATFALSITKQSIHLVILVPLENCFTRKSPGYEHLTCSQFNV